MYLVDTNILSVTAPTKAVAMPGLMAWVDRNSAALFLSVITVAEIEDGISKCRRQGASRKADQLGAWLEALLHLYGARVVTLDIAIARLAGQLADRARSQGMEPGLADLVIAATAQHRGWTVLTRNLRHFGPLGVRALDPYAAQPPESE